MLGALLAGCTAITGDFSNVVAIQYTGPLTPRVAEGDTLTLTAVALDANGNQLPEVPILWRVLEPETVQVGFTLDSLTGLVTGLYAGAGRVRADADGIRTGLLTVTVTAVADSIAALEPAEDTIPASDSESPALGATVYDVPPSGTPKPLAGVSVRFAIVQPAPGTAEAATLAIGAPGQAPDVDPLVVTVVTGTSGIAFATVRRVGQLQPDTAIVEAVALSAAGEVIPGPPARFTIIVLSN
ncbi:MAG: hypothetical protein OEY20_16365 [Gemmatimonadota bacterium]|nr:hypothetical protein [Gemmatimonadota bacterium]MDH4350267.1 hypothetical protein [Gemmatimonadota bacterium]MDH5198816.1 hypothetical protein [Gemmatimonadota bacterium]